jgi:predicted MPP superfamily phosphohydrolase
VVPTLKRVRAIAGLLFAIVAALPSGPSRSSQPLSRLSIPHWHADLAGLRIAVLADLHVGSPFNGIPKLHEIVAITNELKPDLILIPGDFVIQGVIGGGLVTPEDSAAVLATLTTPLGVWACLGNHDWWLDAKRVRSALEPGNPGARG